jgi:hypothetical protein
MHRFEAIDLGEYRGDDYFLVGFVEPEPGGSFNPDEDADNYGVQVSRSSSSPLEDNRQIVRMDTAHGYPHLDKLYLPPDSDEDRKDRLEEGYSYSRMKQFLLANWEAYADLYIELNE